MTEENLFRAIRRCLLNETFPTKFLIENVLPDALLRLEILEAMGFEVTEGVYCACIAAYATHGQCRTPATASHPCRYINPPRTPALVIRQRGVT